MTMFTYVLTYLVVGLGITHLASNEYFKRYERHMHFFIYSISVVFWPLFLIAATVSILMDNMDDGGFT
jgi:hypothetical protein